MIQITSIASYCDHLASWYCDKPKAKASVIQRRSSLGAAWRSGTRLTLIINAWLKVGAAHTLGEGHLPSMNRKSEHRVESACAYWSTSVQLWLFPVPRELQSPSPWGHSSSSLHPPTKTAQSQLKTKAPLAEGRWGDYSTQSAWNMKNLHIPALNHDFVDRVLWWIWEGETVPLVGHTTFQNHHDYFACAYI